MTACNPLHVQEPTLWMAAVSVVTAALSTLLCKYCQHCFVNIVNTALSECVDHTYNGQPPDTTRRVVLTRLFRLHLHHTVALKLSSMIHSQKVQLKQYKSLTTTKIQKSPWEHGRSLAWHKDTGQLASVDWTNKAINME
jgi:hypothetical protein